MVAETQRDFIHGFSFKKWLDLKRSATLCEIRVFFTAGMGRSIKVSSSRLVLRACSSYRGLARALLNKLAKLDHPCFLVTLTSGVPNERQELQHLLNCFIVRATKNFDSERIFENQCSQQAYIFLHPIWFFKINLWLRLCDNLDKFNIIQTSNIFSKLRIQ